MRISCVCAAMTLALAGFQRADARPTPQTAAITYQGQLKQSGAPFNGSVDLQFKLFDSPAAGTQIGSTLALNAVSVVDGVFTSLLDFGALAFNGEERWLEIAVDDTPQSGIGPFVTLAPRQQLTTAPYAAYALNASLPSSYASAVNFTNAGNAFTGAHSGNGAGLTNLNASSVSSGNLAATRLPSSGTWSLTTNLLVGNLIQISPADLAVHVYGDSPVTGLLGGNFTIGGNGVLRMDEDTLQSMDYTFPAGTPIPVPLVINPAGGGVLIGSESPPGGFVGSLYVANGARFGGRIQVDGNIDGDSATIGGNVGIGTTAPAQKLHVSNGGSGGTPFAAAELIVEDNADCYINLMSHAASERGISFGSPTSAVHGGIYYTDAGGMNLRTGNNLSTVIVTPAGLVGIDRVPTTNVLEVAGGASKSTAGSWLANSDRRIKTDIKTVTSALDTLDRVRLASFRYTPEYLKAHPAIEDRRYLNVIAQEFAQVFPEHVKGSGEFLASGEEILQVDIHPLTIYSAAAIQELRAEKDAEISQLRVENDSLRADLDELRMLVRRLIERETRK